MAKLDEEKTKSDELVENLRISLANLCLHLIEDIYQKRAKNPEMVFNSLVQIYNTIKN